MIYAAWFDLHNDDTIVDHPTAMRLYARLVRNPLIFMKPQEIHAWWYAANMGVKRRSVSRAISLLIRRGYAIDHGRGQNNVRRITLAMERPDGAPEVGRAPKGPTTPDP